jgi:hypothetical protein
LEQPALQVAWRRPAVWVTASARVALQSAARCVPEASRWTALAAAYAPAEPQSAVQVRAAEGALDAQAQQPEVAASGVRAERQPEAAVLAAPGQQQVAVLTVEPERHQVAARQGAVAVRAASARRPAARASAAASAFHPGPFPPSSRLVPRPAARFAHAMRC